MENGTLTIALLGQPNSGKSSVFNGLTGAHQHVGNWPGKTVEHKSGSFTQNGTDYAVVDLPGSYSLSTGSQEEVVTTSYIRSGKADLVAILVDSSQLERSLYMLADFIGTRIPAVLILNLMDVAEQKGVKIDTAKLSARLGIPVIGFVAADRKRYPALKAQLADAAAKKQLLREDALMQYYRADAALGFAALADSQEKSSVYTQEKRSAVPYESVFTSIEHVVMGDSRDDVIDWFIQDGFKVNPDLHEPEDHISFELEYLAHMNAKAAALVRAGNNMDAIKNVKRQRKFIEKHLLNWVGQLHDVAQDYAKTTFYTGMLLVCQGALEQAREALITVSEELPLLAA